MVTLTNDPKKVRRLTGIDNWYFFLPPHLSLDGFPEELPLLVHRPDGKSRLLVREIDRGNVPHIPWEKASPIIHTPYFTFEMWERPDTETAPDLISGIRQALRPGDQVRLDGSLPVILAEKLTEALQAEWPEGVTGYDGFLYRIPVDEVLERFEVGRQAVKDGVQPLLEQLDQRAALNPYLDRDAGDRFTTLDHVLAEYGLGAFLASSPLMVQELTGLPYEVLWKGDVWALYRSGESEVLLFAARELPLPRLGERCRLDPRFLRSLTAGARLGFEEVHLTAESYQALMLRDMEAQPSVMAARDWRERRAWEDLAFYVIASHLTLTSINQALSGVEEALRRGEEPREQDAFAAYLAANEETIRGLRLPIQVRMYFCHTHAGNRTPYPSRATDFPLKNLTSLKIDSGVCLYDGQGLLRAVSDITRSLVVKPEAREFYELLDRTLVENVIPACRPGAKGADVFRAGMEVLDRHRSDIVAAGFAPDGKTFVDGVTRNVGHLLCKQEPATIFFDAKNQRTLAEGMIGAAEFQWPYREYCIGTEDFFLVTDAGAINLTRPT